MKKNTQKTALSWIILSVVVIIVDQLTKYSVLTHLAYGQPHYVLSFLNFTLQFNPGAAFSFLGGASGWQVYLLAAIAIIVSICLLVWLSRLQRSNWLVAMPLSLIIGGALGNLIDRLRFGYVIDFIDFHVGHWHYATFNVADSAVSVGAIFLVCVLIYESITGKS